MLLKVEHLNKSFGGIQAIKDVSFHINKGELTSIIGPNGAGKSTLFNLLTGHIPKDSGKIFFKNEDISELAPDDICRKGIGRSFQLLNIFEKMSVYENIQIALLAGKGLTMSFLKPANKVLATETKRIIESVGLGEKSFYAATSISYGDQRRLDIGIALAHKPELVFLDEPCSGLTVEEASIVIRAIEKLAIEQSLTVLLVEHKMDMVFSVSEKIIVLFEGQIVFEGTPEDAKKSEIVRRTYLGENG